MNSSIGLISLIPARLLPWLHFTINNPLSSKLELNVNMPAIIIHHNITSVKY